MKIIQYCILIIIFIQLYIITAFSSVQELNTNDIVVDMVPEKLELQNSNAKTLLIKYLPTGKEWQISITDWEILSTSYLYWKSISTGSPKISKVYEDDIYLYIIFNYYYNNTDEYFGIKINKEKSILSGTVMVPKNYLIQKNAQLNNILYNITIGVGVYSILTTILLLLIIF